jgi:hypothetical protein
MEHVRANIKRLALDLVGPASVVSNAANHSPDVATGHRDGLAIVQRLNGSQQVKVLFRDIGQLDHQLAAVLRGRGAPDAIKCLSRGGHGEIDIFLRGLANAADDLFC